MGWARVENFGPVFLKKSNNIHGIRDIDVIMSEVEEGGGGGSLPLSCLILCQKIVDCELCLILLFTKSDQ